MRLRIRTKLATALAVPLIALVAVAAQEVQRADERAEEVRQEAELANAAAGPTSVISRLQDERNFALIDLLGMVGTLQLPVTSMDEARAATDAAFTELLAFVSEQGSEVEAKFQRIIEGIDLYLAAVRGHVDIYEGPRDLSVETVDFAVSIYGAYAAFINLIITDTAGIALDVADAELRTGVELVTRATIDLENSAEISRAIFYQVLTGSSLDEARLVVAGHLDNFETNRQRIMERAVGPYEGLAEKWLTGPKDAEHLALYTQFVEQGTADINQLSQSLGSTEVPGIASLRAEVTEAMRARADELVADAHDQRNLVAALAIAAVGLALLGTILASFSITRPLRSLTVQADEMATVRLPRAVQQVLDTPLGEDVEVPHVEPIAVATRDEVADVADALNTVQRSALELAVEQAVLRKNIADSFVNLGRRNQELLDRQLDLITDLERRAEDPDRLEGLFRLDHLATRMRRNAESLLRLAGGDEVLDGGLGAPVPVVDVIRGALGEVEGYQRVEVMSLDPALVDGAAGADIAHAVAELVENALTFSPPEETVRIRGRRRGEGYVIAVIDQGVGMSEEQLAVANRRLAGEESFTVAPSRYLGHYVAGHLASTHGVKIRLQQETLGGITARVELPASVLIDDGTPAPVRAPEPEPEPIVARQPEPAPEPEPIVAREPEPAPVAPIPPEPVAPAPPLATVEVPPVEAAGPLPHANGNGNGNGNGIGIGNGNGNGNGHGHGNGHVPGNGHVAEPELDLQLRLGERPRPEPPIDTTPPPLTRREAVARATEQSTEAPPPANFTAAQVTGLTRRIRGANAPKATNVAAAFGGGAPVREARPASAEDVAAFLAAFDGGVSRGLAETRGDDGRTTS